MATYTSMNIHRRKWASPTKQESMGWLRSAGSIKLQVSFAEYRPFDRALLQKRPIILLILLTEATPYVNTHSYTHMFVYVLIYPS